MPFEHEMSETSSLAPQESAVLDALVDAGFEVDALPESQRPRARRLAQLFGLIDTPINDGRTDLVDRTMRLVGAASRVHASEASALTTSDDDALEAWVMAGGRLAHVPNSLRERAARHEALAALVRGTPIHGDSAAARAELVQATLDLVQQEVDAQGERMVLRRRRSFRLADVVSVAAVLLLGASVALPVLGVVRQEARKGMCDANLGRVAQAMGVYAGSNNSSLPMATAGFGGGSWMKVGEDPRQSNSANLYVLVRGKYVPISDLACPGNPNAPRVTEPDARDWQRLEEVSYSYQVQDGKNSRLWRMDQPVPIVADRSPVVLRISRNEPIFPEENSPNHSSNGQHIMWTDGSITWATTPVRANGDNIWLPRPIEQAVEAARRYYGMTGREIPDSVDDALLGP